MLRNDSRVRRPNDQRRHADGHPPLDREYPRRRTPHVLHAPDRHYRRNGRHDAGAEAPDDDGRQVSAPLPGAVRYNQEGEEGVEERGEDVCLLAAERFREGGEDDGADRLADEVGACEGSHGGGACGLEVVVGVFCGRGACVADQSARIG